MSIELLERVKKSDGTAFDDLDASLHQKVEDNFGYTPNKTERLLSAGLDLFTPESVAAYQAAEERRVFRPQRIKHGYWTVAWFLWTAAFAYATYSITPSLMLITLAGCALGIIMSLAFVTGFPTGGWFAIPLRKYDQPIPEFAMATALKVQAEFPNKFKMHVESLEQSNDPFLVAIDKAGRKYYLEVWNEPNYKQERMA